MALKLLNPGIDPIGMFDGYDSEVLTLLGGEVVSLISVLAHSDKAAADSFDGYVNPFLRPVVTRTLSSGSRPLMLADEGIAGYGTLFGSVVGGVAGQNTNGAALGPHTATGSGKVTCWDKPGLYGVTLDACDLDITVGLQPSNPTLTTGAALVATSTGLLTPAASGHGVTPILARFVSFESTAMSLVTTPVSLVSALSPKKFSMAVFYFAPPIG